MCSFLLQTLKLSVSGLDFQTRILSNLTFKVSNPWPLPEIFLQLLELKIIVPLHNLVTWYKVTYTGEQIAHWNFQNNAPAFVLEVPLRNMLTSIFNFVLCDRVVQRAYSSSLNKGNHDHDSVSKSGLC